MKIFRTIQYGLMLFDSLRNYFSTNSNGGLSILYRYLISCLYVLQSPFDNFHIWRNEKKLIAGCAYQIGQFTNLLNYIYDNKYNRIYITQPEYTLLLAPTFDDGVLLSDMILCPTFDDGANISDITFSTTFDDMFYFFSTTTIWIPNELYIVNNVLNQIIATIEQIKINGLTYEVKPII